MGPGGRGVLLAAFLAAAGGCSLTEVTTTAAEDIVVVEALLLRPDQGALAPPRLQVFLHRTVQGEEGANEPVDDAEVRVLRPNGSVVELRTAELADCVAATPERGTGSCYLAPDAGTREIRPGERLALTVTTREGEVMEAVSVVPGAFAPATVADEGTCRVEPNDPLEVVWSASEGAWAYLNEIEIEGLPEALPELSGVEIPDPLFLFGLSVSATDTTIVAPNEFGIFDRFDLDQPLAVALQQGLPAGSQATVSITAVDRNYVNWLRGGGFNPSGQVRIPSVRGMGTGFFGTGVVRTFRIVTDGEATPCRRFSEEGGASGP